MRQAGLFGLSDHLKRLSAHGDPLEELGRVIDFEAFRPVLVAALAYGDGAKGGRPPYDPVAMLKVLVLAAQNNVADGRMECLIRDRLSWLRFLGFDLGAPTPDANTIRLFREKLTEAGALAMVFADFDRQLKERGYLAMGGQIVDATLVAAPKQRNTAPEKDAIKAGKKACEIWPEEPAKAAQKDTDARWTLKFAKAKPLANGKPGIDIAIPSFGYKSPRASATRAVCRSAGPSALSARARSPTQRASTDGCCVMSSAATHRLRCLGRHGLSEPSQRGMAQAAEPGQPHPSQEATRQADARTHHQSQRRQIQNPRPRGACVRPAERPEGAVHPHHRHQARRSQDYPRQPRLQHAPPHLP